MKRIISTLLCLFLCLCLLPGTAFAADNSRSYDFDLSIEGNKGEVRAHTDQILTVTLVLKRTDRTEPADMYGMQTEIIYDDTFLQLVENSVMTSPGVEWRDMGRRTGGRALYLNFVSFSGGESWKSEVIVGSFQMKVIADHGTSRIVPQNCLVVTKDGNDTFGFTSNDVIVMVSTECTVTFEENGGSEVPDQTVQYGEKIKKPADPIREGYYLKGWYSDLDCTELWDFDQDTVQENMTLYAGWAVKDTPGASTPNSGDGFPWWILMTMLGSGLLLILLVIYSRKRTSTASGNHVDDNFKGI